VSNGNTTIFISGFYGTIFLSSLDVESDILKMWNKRKSGFHNGSTHQDVQMLIYLYSGFENVIISPVSGHIYRKW
jgi:hypothetical protein